MDGCRYSLREAHGWRVLYALWGAGRINAYRPPDYRHHVRAGGDPDVGRYRLQYDGLTPFWRWDRAVGAEVTA